MRKFFCKELTAPGEAVFLEEREAEHLFRVLRAREGDEVELLTGDGRRAVAAVRGRGMLEVVSVTEVPEERPRFHLFFAPPRRNRLDLLLTQATEMGVAELHPVLFARGVAESEPNDRWQLHLREGCKQSGNPRIPVVHPLQKLDRALADFAAVNGAGYYGSVEMAEMPPAADAPPADAGWIVGPEGGFTDAETAAIREAGWQPLHLGPHILRLETAAICGIAVLRKIFTAVLPLLICAVMAAGCGDARAKVERNPLVIKARQYTREGDGILARRFYRRALCKFPASPLLHLELALLCDETLGDYAEAIWHYDEYLRLVPEEHPGRDDAQLYRRLAVNRFVLEQDPALQKSVSAADPDAAALREENRLLRRQIGNMKQMIHRQHQQLRQLRAAAAPADREAVSEVSGGSSGENRYHTVSSGDTPGGIARRYRVPLRELLRSNGLQSSSILHIGQKLIIPAAAGRR